MHLATFEAKKQKILENNQNATRGWTEGVNHFTDWTQDEIDAMLNKKSSRKIGGESDRRDLEAKRDLNNCALIPGCAALYWNAISDDKQLLTFQSKDW